MKTNTGDNSIYEDYTTSGTAVLIVDSSADPSTCPALWTIGSYQRFTMVPVLRFSVHGQSSERNSLTPEEVAILTENIRQDEFEPEDQMLAESGVLDRLLEEAIDKPPIIDWKRHLDEL